MTRQKVLILTTAKSDLAEHTKEFEQFQKRFETHIHEVVSRDDLRSRLQKEFSDVSAIWVTGEAIDDHGGVLQFVAYFPKTVKVYVYPWVGYLNEEAKALRDRGIVMCNVGDVSSNDVADHALFLTLSIFKLTSYLEKQFRSNMNCFETKEVLGSQSFGKNGEPLPPPERANLAFSTSIGGKKLESPTGKIAGIVGLGSIGKEIGRRLNAIGMKIRYTKRSPLTSEEEEVLGYKAEYYQSFDELITEVDLIVLAVPHSPQTIHLINKESLKRVKKGVRIVNIGRGSAIDEEALLEALDNGIVTSAGLDVFNNEPTIDPRFASRWDVTLTPHVANTTTDNTVNANLRSMNNVVDVLLHNGNGLTAVN